MTNSVDGMILDLGCGKCPHPDADLGVDLHPVEGADIISTLDVADGIGYIHFNDDIASEVHLRHTLEHLSDLDHILSELCRITQPGGEIHIRVPYYNSLNAAVDPTHTDIVNHMTEHTFSYYEDNVLSYETGDASFKILDISYEWRDRGLLQRLLPPRMKYELRHEIGNLVEELVVDLQVTA
jgi:SAM-dependent methyltransferase